MEIDRWVFAKLSEKACVPIDRRIVEFSSDGLASI